MLKQSLIALSVAALAACNGADSTPAGVDPAFDQVVVSADFFGEWEGSVTVFTTLQQQAVDFSLAARAASGRNLAAACEADMVPVGAAAGKAYYRVKVTAGPCIQNALMEFDYVSVNSLLINMHPAINPAQASVATVVASGSLNRKPTRAEAGGVQSEFTMARKEFAQAVSISKAASGKIDTTGRRSQS